jgi:photosystem II stability/assembly factor-like uncharacterized protein
MKKITLIIIFLSSLVKSHAQWVHHNPGTTDFLSDIDFVSEQIGFVQDWDNGMLWGTTDGGINWTMLLNNTPVYFMNFISGDTGFTASQGLYRTIDGGHFWDPVISDPEVFWWSRPFFLNHSLGYTVQSSYRQGAPMDSIITYITQDGGTNWNIVSAFADSVQSMPVDNVFFFDPLIGYFVSGPRAYKTIDGGVNWSLILADDNDYYLSCFFISPDTGFIGTLYSHKILKTSNGGLSWQIPIVPISTPVYDIRFISTDVGYACGGDGFTSGFIIKTVDGGQVWTLDYGDNFTYNTLSWPSENFGYACGMGDSVVKYYLDDDIADKNSELINNTNYNLINDILSINKLPFSTNEISIYNTLGIQVFHCEYSARKNFNLDLSVLPRGIYIVHATGFENVWQEKVIKY